MSDLKDKLASILARHDVVTGRELRRRLEELQQRRAAGEYEIDKVVPGELIQGKDSAFYLVRTQIPMDTPHGVVPLNSIHQVIPEHIALAACDAELEDFDPTKTIFLDVETTGLAGGTGTVAFLVGLGYIKGEVLHVDQCFLRDFDDEPAMLDYTQDVLKHGDTIVSYNGKSFDVPLLRTRFIQNRLRPATERLRQLDLLHASRRLWKARLADCSLRNVEEGILGFRRHGDIPSEEIPEIWLEYLRTRDARKLDRVFYHHRMDVVSLVALTSRLSQNISAAHENRLEYAEDHLSLIRLLFRQRAYHQVVELGNKLLETETEPALRCACFEYVGFALKRQGYWDEMENLWRRLLHEVPNHLVAYLELAKFYEHRARDLSQAEQICRAALQFLETRVALREDPLDENYRDAFQFRLERIQRKLSRNIQSFFEEP